MCNKIVYWEHFTIWKNAKRNLIDIEDFDAHNSHELLDFERVEEHVHP